MRTLFSNWKARASQNTKQWPGQIVEGSVLLAIGALGALLADRIGMPGGAVVGALLAVGIFYIVRGETGPWQRRFGRVGRLLLGTVVGAAFTADVLAPLKIAVLPMIAVVVTLTGVGLAMGWLLYRSGKVNFATAMVGAVPGGLPAMVGIAADMHADSAVVAAIHVSRLTSILLIVPGVLALLVAGSHGAVASAPAAVAAQTIPFWHTMLTLAIGLAAGLLAVRLRVPSGDLIGPILVVGTANVLGAGLGPLADGLLQFALIVIGAGVGTQLSKESLKRLKPVALPAAMVIAMLILTGLLLGWGLSLITPIDLATALVSCAPGGASTLTGIATDLGADMRLVAALQLVRQLVVLLLVPLLVERVLRSKRPHGTPAAHPGSSDSQHMLKAPRRDKYAGRH
jgi:membrane AbrB-like protein